MNKISIEHKYDISDEVYHVTPESPKGIIIEWRYYRGSNEVYYLVSIGYGQEHWCIEKELSFEKTVI